MTRIFYKIGIITLILFFESYTKNISFSADLTKSKIEILPIASFIFAQREPIRVGWYNLPKSYKNNSSQYSNSKPIGSLFVQLRPRKFEGENELAQRVLKNDSNQFQLIKKFTKINCVGIIIKLYLGKIKNTEKIATVKKRLNIK